MIATRFYLTKLSSRDLRRLDKVLHLVGETSLELGAEITQRLQEERQRRIRNAEGAGTLWGPEPLRIDCIRWTDQQVADALRAASTLACWSRRESVAIAKFGDQVLLLVSSLAARRLDERAEDVDGLQRDLQLEIASAAEPPVCFALVD